MPNKPRRVPIRYGPVSEIPGRVAEATILGSFLCGCTGIATAGEKMFGFVLPVLSNPTVQNVLNQPIMAHASQAGAVLSAASIPAIIAQATVDHENGRQITNATIMRTLAACGGLILSMIPAALPYVIPK